MLANKMSNQDEDEVEDELEALEAEVKGVTLPDAPVQQPQLTAAERAQIAKDRAQRRAREKAAEQESQLVAA
jgi:charged multivesicular body protein 6